MEKKIQDYLAKNLPFSEERIPTPMHPKCEVCVVIPSYGEREYILRPLESLAYQKGVGLDKYEVVVVVNNPGNPPQKAPNQSDEACRQRLENYRRVVQNNRDTLKLLQYINSEVPGNVDIQLSDRENGIIAVIKQKGLHVFSIDKSSPGKTLPDGEANVGGARNRGTAEAVERFYKQVGNNGIIAHTDADAWTEEYYIKNLIEAFEKNSKLVGLAGRDEDILLDPWDREAMADFLISDATIQYFHLTNQLFNGIMPAQEREVSPVFFIGSNMAGRAFETAMAGGIARVTGGEDYSLARELNKIGSTVLDLEVIIYPGIRYSDRTTTGKGFRMMQSSRTNQGKNEVKVRSLEAAYQLYDIYRALQMARINHNNSVENLSEILVIQNKPIFNRQELERFSQNLDQFDTPLPELLNKDLQELVKKLCKTIENEIGLIPLTQAVSKLTAFYLINKEIKKVYQSVKEKAIQKRKKNIEVLEYILDKIFEDEKKHRRNDPRQLEEKITSLLEKNQTTLFSQLLKRRYRLKRAAQLIALADTKTEAMELLKINFMMHLVEPEPGTELSAVFELKILNKVVKKLRGQPGPK